MQFQSRTNQFESATSTHSIFVLRNYCSEFPGVVLTFTYRILKKEIKFEKINSTSCQAYKEHKQLKCKLKSSCRNNNKEHHILT